LDFAVNEILTFYYSLNHLMEKQCRILNANHSHLLREMQATSQKKHPAQPD
jgi:hypothetical protein